MTEHMGVCVLAGAEHEINFSLHGEHWETLAQHFDFWCMHRRQGQYTAHPPQQTPLLRKLCQLCHLFLPGIAELSWGGAAKDTHVSTKHIGKSGGMFPKKQFFFTYMLIDQFEVILAPQMLYTFCNSWQAHFGSTVESGLLGACA